MQADLKPEVTPRLGLVSWYCPKMKQIDQIGNSHNLSTAAPASISLAATAIELHWPIR